MGGTLTTVPQPRKPPCPQGAPTPSQAGHGLWQEDRHRHRRVNVARNLAMTRKALLAIIPFDGKRNLPSLIAGYQHRKQLAIDLVLKARPLSITSPAKHPGRPAIKWLA